MYYYQKKQLSKANAQYTPCIIYGVVCQHSCVTHNSKFINDDNCYSYNKFDLRLKFLTYCSRFILNFLCVRAVRPKEPAKVNSKLTWKKTQPVTYIMYMYMIMLMQLHCIYFWFIGNHTLCKLHVYYTHKDTKQYWFGPFILYTCTMYFGERFFKFAFLLQCTFFKP